MSLGPLAPGQPVIIPEECSCENNSVTIAWAPQLGSVVEAYTLELDDGNGGDFRVSLVQYMGGIFGNIVGQMGPKWDKSGTFSDQISAGRQNVLKSDLKKPRMPSQIVT